jgi:hypothetical protein
MQPLFTQVFRINFLENLQNCIGASGDTMSLLVIYEVHPVRSKHHQQDEQQHHQYRLHLYPQTSLRCAKL